MLTETTPLGPGPAPDKPAFMAGRPAVARRRRRERWQYAPATVGGFVVATYLLAAVLAPWISPHDPAASDLRLRLAPPAWESKEGTYLLGGDDVGRDLLSRIIHGGRASLGIGFLTVAIACGIGTGLGLAAGYRGGAFDYSLSRFADLLLAFPLLIFAIGIMSVLGPGTFNLILALTFKSWVEFFRLARGAVLVERAKEYVEAARAQGRRSASVLLVEILPNIAHAILVLATLRVGYIIINEASLSFLGLGIQPPTPAWGSMVNQGRAYLLNGWWISTFPGLAIVTLVLGINLFGEGLREALDQRLAGR